MRHSIERYFLGGFVSVAQTVSNLATRVTRRYAWLGILMAAALGTSVLHASALHVGTPVNDVPAAPFGTSNVTRAVGAASDGTIYVGFFSQNAKQIRVAKSVDRGATFAASVLVDTAQASATFTGASLIVDSSGDVLVAYVSNASGSNVSFARSSNAGTSFTVISGFGTASSTFNGVRLATQGDYVYVGYPGSGGYAVATSANAGVSFNPPVTVVSSGGGSALLVDASNGDLVFGSENANLYLRVSHDHGATFDPEQHPAGQVFFSNWTISSDVSGRFVWVAGAAISAGGTDNAYQINLADFSAVQRNGFLLTSTNTSRSLAAAGCGEVVDSVDGSWAVIRNFGTTTGTTYTIAGSNQTTAIDSHGDVLIAYQSGTAIELDVYENELTGCGARVSATITDAHAFARFGQTLNYLVTVSDEFTAASNVAVTLSTPGTALDLAHASWDCIGSDPAVICPASSGAGASLGNVAVAAASSMTWIVSVPVRTATTDETIQLDVNATGATKASDIDALVIFRSGFDVANSDGTQ